MVVFGLFITFLLGAAAALRMPVPVFMVLLALMTAGLMVTQIYAGRGWGEAAIWSVAYAIVLQIGYVASHILFYLNRASARRRSQDAASRASAQYKTDNAAGPGHP